MSASALFNPAIASFHLAVNCDQLWNAEPRHTAGSGSIAAKNALAWLFNADTDVSRFDACWFTALSVIENFVDTQTSPRLTTLPDLRRLPFNQTSTTSATRARLLRYGS